MRVISYCPKRKKKKTKFSSTIIIHASFAWSLPWRESVSNRHQESVCSRAESTACDAAAGPCACQTPRFCPCRAPRSDRCLESSTSDAPRRSSLHKQTKQVRMLSLLSHKNSLRPCISLCSASCTSASDSASRAGQTNRLPTQKHTSRHKYLKSPRPAAESSDPTTPRSHYKVSDSKSHVITHSNNLIITHHILITLSSHPTQNQAKPSARHAQSQCAVSGPQTADVLQTHRSFRIHWEAFQ